MVNEQREKYTAEEIEAKRVRSDVFKNDDGAVLQTLVDGQVAVIADGVGMIDAVDPSATTTPIADARDTIKAVADSGEIHYSGVIEEQSGLGDGYGVPLAGIELHGHAVKKSTPVQGVSSEIHFTQTGSTGENGLLLTTNDDHGGIYDTIIRGPGQGTTTEHAVDFSAGTRGFDLDRVYILDWSKKGVTNVGGGAAFEMDWGFVQVTDVDGIPFDWNNGGAPNQVDYLKLNADDTNTATGVMNMANGNWNIGTLNAGGDVSGDFGVGAAIAIKSAGDAHNHVIGFFNYEPGSETGVSKVFTVRSPGTSKILGGKVSAPTAKDYIVGLNVNPGNKYIANISVKSTLNNTVIDVQADPGGNPIVYEGLSSEVTNNTGAALTSPGISCLADLSLVT